VTSLALGRPRDAAEDRARALLELLGLAGLEQASAHRLSGGEQRRLVVAAALVHGPAGVLLDEPTVGQDRLTWATVVGACASATDAGAAVGVATHDAVAIEALTTGRGETLVLADGRVARDAA
ncbi:MAG TPA: ATP-binding cassette domain-containing protein, partial [Nocardioidaceae bacterium]|nr:ATP-binding cassette domain-containing protein [Nocardioidaceae bacterium]